jgi:hypothetical protein
MAYVKEIFMKRYFVLLAILFFTATAVIAQPIQVQKSTYVAKENNTFHANQVAATNTKTGMTLVVWERATSSGRQISGRILNNRGAAAQASFTLVTDPNAAHPAVIYNPAANEFLLAYDDNPQIQLKHTDIYVMRLNAQGRPASGAVKITTDSVSTAMANFNPKLAFNSRNSSYAVLWLREVINSGQTDDGTNGLVGALLSSNVSLNGNVVLLQKTTIESSRLWEPIPQDVLFHPGNGKLLVVYVQVRSGTSGMQADYVLGRFDPTLSGANFAQVNASPILLSSGFSWGSRIAFTTNTAGLVFFVDTNNILRRKIDAAGNLSGSPLPGFRPPKNNTKLFYPAVAFTTVDSLRRGILLAVENPFSETGVANVWAQPLDATGAPLGAPMKVDTTATNDTALSSQIVALPAAKNLNGFRFSGFYTLAQFTSPGQTFQSAGIVKLNLTIPPKK